ncbi:MAG: arsenate reductase ArsC [Gammaproteobacteria bacterium]|nr:arsenate reductase ArsC [Gammaproteobacteria bacterium]
MNPNIYNVLFLCTGNSARSIMGEALLNHMLRHGGRFRGFSAGSHPKGQIHPLTLKLLSEHQVPVGTLRSKHWDEFARADAPRMDFVFTVCDQAAGESCPLWPGQPVTAHWGLPDPAACAGDEATRVRAFRDTLTALRRRLELFIALPLEKLDRLALQRRVVEIGRS